MKVDIDNDTNAKIINVVAGLLDSWGMAVAKSALAESEKAKTAEEISKAIERGMKTSRIIKKLSLSSHFFCGVLALLSIKTFSSCQLLFFLFLLSLAIIVANKNDKPHRERLHKQTFLSRYLVFKLALKAIFNPFFGV